MITTNKNIDEYSFTCENCGKIMRIASNQPTGDYIPVICECFKPYNLTIEGETGKYRYKMREDTKQIRKGIINIIRDIKQPMTIRQIFYRAVAGNLVPKDEQKGYNLIQRNVLEMRRYGHLPYQFVSDLSRRRMKPDSFNNASDALDRWMNYYRQDIWAKQDVHIEVWLEKDALSRVFSDITMQYDVPLYIARGFSSESFLYEAAEEIKAIGKPTYIYFFSDYDPSGLKLCDQVKEKLPLFGVENMHFIRAALTPQQIYDYDLPARPTKSNKHYKGEFGESTELDAMHPYDLQNMIEGCIKNHISNKEIENIEIEEQMQRESIEKVKHYIHF